MMKGGKTIMFDTLTRIYKKTKGKTYLENAVKKGWLTEEEKNEILKAEE
jgi:hypothetical protein